MITDDDLSFASAINHTGFAGTELGVADASSDPAPIPDWFSARISNSYVVPFDNSGTAHAVVAAPLLGTSSQLP